MNNIFIQLAVILTLSSALGFIAYKFKLPLLIAYLLGGLILAYSAVFDVGTSEVLHFFPEIGIAFMLFLVGMELDLREIKALGKPILVASFFQIFITTVLGSIIAKYLGFGSVESWYLGAGLAFSSTVVVVKLLLDKKESTSLYGKLSLGILLLEDLLAVMILLFLTVTPSSFGLGYQQFYPTATLIIKIILLFGIGILLNRFVLPKIFRAVAESGELLFLTSLAWCFIYVSLALILGFSVLIGAFLAGVSLASSVYHFRIQGKVKPLRDFFVTLFFVYLGTQVNFLEVGRALPLIIAFVAYALFCKPLIILLALGIFGFRKHTMFQTAINLSQISEFSLILLLVGAQKGLVSSTALTAIALTGVISMIISSVLVTHTKKLYKKLNKLLGFFERKNYNHFLEVGKTEKLTGHVVIIGSHRIGGEVVKLLKKQGIAQIVLDFNPHIVQSLLKMHVPVVYGDLGDPEVLDALDLKDARMVISTSPSFDGNRLLLEELKTRKINIPAIIRASTTKQADELYKRGADLAVIPEILAGDYLLQRLKDYLSGNRFQERIRIERKKHSHKTFFEDKKE
ncbi:cation:proton antiporter [Patescibacteria group bacterium]|nr:cation:proton antiporter [Patescibacteria group bacterium]